MKRNAVRTVSFWPEIQLVLFLKILNFELDK
jgi:hypothetical protein